MSVEGDIRAIFLLGIGQIPDYGGMASGVVGVLWPAPQADVWGDIKDRVEKLIDEKLDKEIEKQLIETLHGLQRVMQNYADALKDYEHDPEKIFVFFEDALTQLEANLDHFKSAGHEVLLLPLFAQFANMHLSLLRDGALLGKNWGMTQEGVDRIIKKIYKYGGDYRWHVQKTYPDAHNAAKQKYAGLEPKPQWTALNKFVREMTLMVLDFAEYWPYFAPDEPRPKLKRELYSDPIGNGHDHRVIKIGDPEKNRMSKAKVWGFDRIDAIQQAFGGKLGKRMGNQHGGSDAPPNGWTGDIEINNQIAYVSGRAGDVLDSMQLHFENGEKSNLCGGGREGGEKFVAKIDGHIVSRFYITRADANYGTAETLVVAYRFHDGF
ncbi:insecticidal delta-endotoxin Cry8Ea1 family protein [uncultured Tateyamaria sp.]|uniref:insecticidal delta-endotoxin Cry8Ea1 family protein n=1 Tax=Tateyamaria sp. 1078 TaxID=3417464 RepID=UPI002619F864|nr:insecticidal delta-endotoxin Cry8Ea1 family protein [uncultured Tateyamaria sp.]